MRNRLLSAYNSNQCPNMWCRSHQQASGAVEDTVYSTSRLKQIGKSSLWMADCALFRRRRWLSLRRWMKFVCTPSIINTTMKTPYLLTTYSFKAGWCSGEGTRLPVMWPGSKSGRRPHMWVEFVVGSLLYSQRFLSGSSGFPLSSSTNTSKFQFVLKRTDTFKRILKNS